MSLRTFDMAYCNRGAWSNSCDGAKDQRLRGLWCLCFGNTLKLTNGRIDSLVWLADIDHRRLE